MALPTFNGFSLQDNNYIVSDIEYRTWPKRDLSIMKIARRAGSKLTNTDFAERKISMRGHIIGSSVSDLQAKIDALYLELQKESKTLEIESNRFYTATTSSVTVSDPYYSQSMVPFEVEFTCVDPFAYGPTQSASMIVTSGSMTQTYSITISGTYAAEPTFIYSTPLTGVNNTTTSGIKATHISSGQYILWSGTGSSTYIPYSSNLTLDYSNYKLLLDDNQLNYSGVFTEMQPGVNQLQIQYMGNTVGGTLSVSYAPRYL